jgi:hypothetical protein
MWSTFGEMEDFKSATKLNFDQKLGKVGKNYLFYEIFNLFCIF